MSNTKYKTYHVLVELDLLLRDNSIVTPTADGIAACVRHAVRTFMPTGSCTKAGYKFDANTVHAELKQEKDNVDA